MGGADLENQRRWFPPAPIPMISIGIALALACAFTANLGFFFKHRGACAAPAVEIRHPLRTTRRLWGSKWFAVGMGVAGVAWLLHVAALAVAPITYVQIALAAGVVMIGVMADRIFGVTVGARQWWGLGLTTAGLALIALTLPGQAVQSHSAYQATTMAVFEFALLAVGGALVLGTRAGAPARHHGALLAGAAGVLFGVSDIAIKALTGAGDLAEIATSPWLAVTAIASVGAFFSSARGLQLGDPVPVIAITGVAANVTTIAAGVVVFGDPLPGTTLGIVAQAAAFVLILVASALTPAPVAAQPQPAGA